MSEQVKEASDKIKVAIRVRPLIEREKNSNVAINWKVSPPNKIYQIDRNDCVIEGTQYVFDRVFSYIESNAEVYNELCKDVVNSVFNGMHGTIFAYGQTSSGKTFTMSGNEVEEGVILQAINDIFSLIETVPEREYLLRVSFMEIYNEIVTDLLVENLTRLEVKENTNKEVFVDGLTERVVSTPEDVMKLLSLGHGKRQVRDTALNERSSRSHAIFRMIIESKLCESGNEGAVQVSHLNLVDLAGSEPAGQMGTTGPRFTEGVNINQSLLNLGTLIKALSEGQPGVYRNSKLTRILQNSLGGNARTAIICNVTPTAIDQTQSTIKFAKRAKTICNKPRVNEVLSDQAQLQKHKRKIQDLEKELRRLKSDQGVKDDVEKELREKNRRIQELELLAQDLKANVLVSSMTPKMIMRKQRRETWGGNLKGFGKTASIGPDFPQMKPKSQSQSQFDTESAGSPSLRTRHDVTIQNLTSSNASNITKRKPKTKEVRFRTTPSTYEDFSTPIFEESFRESDVFEDDLRIEEEKKQIDAKEIAQRLNFVTSELENLKTKSSNEIARLREILNEKDSIIIKLENQIKREILSFSSVERFCESGMDVVISDLESRLQNEIKLKLELEKKVLDLTLNANEIQNLRDENIALKNEISEQKTRLPSKKDSSVQISDDFDVDEEKTKLRTEFVELQSRFDELWNQNEIVVKKNQKYVEDSLKSFSDLQIELNSFKKRSVEMENEIKENLKAFDEISTKLRNKDQEINDERTQFEIKLQNQRKIIDELTSNLENEIKARKGSERLIFELETKLESKAKSSTDLEVKLQDHRRIIDDLTSKLENENKSRKDLERFIFDLETKLEGFEKRNPKTQEAGQQCDIDTNLRLTANCCLEKELDLKKALEEISSQKSLITVLKFDLEEEQLKFQEYFEDTTEERWNEAQEILKLEKENQEIVKNLQKEILKLTTENESLNEKILNVERQQLANDANDDRSDEIKNLTVQLSEERSRRCQAESKLSNETKRCESLKRECKSYDEKISHLTVQLRKTQMNLNETILPSKKTSPLKEVAASSNASVERLGNIGAMQVIEVQRKLYHLQQHCKSIEEQNDILRLKYKELKKRYSLKDKSDVISDPKTTKLDEKENLAAIEAVANTIKNPVQSFIPINQLDVPSTPTQKFNTVTDYSDFTLTIQPHEQM